jgi:P27 family predicted phage terminase small subunit
LLRGNRGRRPLRPEPEPAIEPACPEPPSFLGAYARDEWWRCAPELHRLGLLSVLDVAPFAVYCHAYHRWRTAEEVLAGMGERDALTYGLLIRSVDGNPRRNPLVKIAADAAAEMIGAAGQYGMTPVARSRIAAGIGGRPGGGKFTGLLAGD